MPTDHFGDPIAQHYDTDQRRMFAPAVLEPTVDILTALVAEDAEARNSALEFAIGTGRVALPLAARGITVDGIDFSPAMLERLRSKPGAAAITAVEGDIARTSMGRTYSLVFLVFNTIGNLMTQDAQVECFANASRHLGSGGHFLIENNVPRLRELTPGSDAIVFDASDRHVGVDQFTDLVAQQAVSRHYVTDLSDADDDPGAHIRYEETPYRYVWPSELDLMARLAGMVLVERWADWDRSPFTADSTKHISVWCKQPIH